MDTDYLLGVWIHRWSMRPHIKSRRLVDSPFRSPEIIRKYVASANTITDRGLARCAQRFAFLGEMYKKGIEEVKYVKIIKYAQHKMKLLIFHNHTCFIGLFKTECLAMFVGRHHIQNGCCCNSLLFISLQCFRSLLF